MSITKMSKISLAGDIDDKGKIITQIMKLGVVEIIDFDSRNCGDEYEALNSDGLIKKDNEDEGVAKFEADMALIGSSINLLERYHPEKLPMFSSRKEISIDEYKDIVSEFDGLWKVASELSKDEDRLHALMAEENRHSNVVESLLPWRELPMPMEFGGTKNTRIAIGTMPLTITGVRANSEKGVSAIEQARLALVAEAPESVLAEVSADRLQSYVFVMYHTDIEEPTVQCLKRFGFSRIQFKDISGTAEQNIDSLQKRIQQIKNEREKIEEAIVALAPEKKKLQVLYDYLQIRCERLKVAANFGKTEKTFMLEGWLPSELVETFTAEINSKFPCCIEIATPEKGEPHPIFLKNPRLVQAFEPITEMYSLPSVNDVDPNKVMAPFYFIFFGLMIGDFGYGVILSLATAFILAKFKPQGMAGRMIKMLCLGGISTAIWGMAFGGYLGNLPQAVAGWITGNDYSGKFYGLWFDPLSDPMKLLFFSMILGGVHLFSGMAIKIYMLVKDGKIFEAIFDVASWYILIIGIVLIMLGMGFGMYMALAGALMLVLTQGRDQKNPVMKLMNGILSLYDITGYLGDVLSYSRLLALGLATGVIAAVINTLATLSPPGIVSFITFILIILVGTVFNLAINALGAFVHASRLQYVEFFGKFYEGGGESFKPFRINTKYIKIIGGRRL